MYYKSTVLHDSDRIQITNNITNVRDVDRLVIKLEDDMDKEFMISDYWIEDGSFVITVKEYIETNEYSF